METSSCSTNPDDAPPALALPGITRLIGDEVSAEIIYDLHLLFLSETEECLAAIDGAAHQRDTAGLALFLHRLQGSASSVGADELAALAKTLERAARAEKLEAVLASLASLSAIWVSLKSAVERDLARFATG